MNELTWYFLWNDFKYLLFTIEVCGKISMLVYIRYNLVWFGIPNAKLIEKPKY